MAQVNVKEVRKIKFSKISKKLKNVKKTHFSLNNLFVANNFIFLSINYRVSLKFLAYLVEYFRFYGNFRKHAFKKSDLFK